RILQVENVLFKVHRSVLVDKSLFFRDMFDVTHDFGFDESQGSSDQNPIINEGSTVQGFELFLSVLYDKWRPDAARMSDEMMVQLLQLSQKYQSKSAREHGLKRLQNRLWHISPTKLVSISLKYQIKDVFEHAFSQLVWLHVNKLDCDILTIPVWNTLIMAKEQLDLHRRIVACEPPPMVHLTCCQDRKTCDDDWRQVWWNGMGRFLLNGRNPLSFDDTM
ncbi:hypothetical protein SCLCIDRAFT_1173263, partial [Scleroderma citrinum Foug A]